MTAGPQGAFGKGTFILGCACAALLPLVILDMAAQLPYVPDAWWQPEGPAHPGRFDLRMMVICVGPVGWLGLWGYLLTIIWAPFAGYRIWRAIQNGVALRTRDRVLLILIPILVIVIELMHHLTPLKFGYPLL